MLKSDQTYKLKKNLTHSQDVEEDGSQIFKDIRNAQDFLAKKRVSWIDFHTGGIGTIQNLANQMVNG